MDDNSNAPYKQVTDSAKRGIKGEAFFESLVVSHALPHRITRETDLGIDYLCEWVHGDRPTGILFAAQVKSTTGKTVKLEECGKSKWNGLDKFAITNGSLSVDERTLGYWKGLGLPTFLFAVVEQRSNDETNTQTDLNCYYKRYTPRLDGHASDDDRNSTKLFYKVNHGAKFRAFADPQNKEIGGFARDLLIDYVRLQYSKGHIVRLMPETFGFWPFHDKDNLDAVRWFPELVEWYESMIRKTCEWTKSFLEQVKATQTTDPKQRSDSS